MIPRTNTTKISPYWFNTKGFFIMTGHGKDIFRIIAMFRKKVFNGQK